MEDGIDTSAESLVQDCNAGLNVGHGINASSNNRIIGNVCHENDLSGIFTSASRTLIQDNRVTDNDDIGILVTSFNCFVFGNVAAGNVDDPSNNDGEIFDNNIQVSANSNYGPIIDVTNVGDISTIAGANHPFANFIY